MKVNIVSGENRTVTLTPLVVFDQAGTQFVFPGGTLTVPANSTHFLGFNLWDGSAVCLSRKLDSGVLWVGSVITDGRNVISVNSEDVDLPASRVERLKAKLRNGRTVRIIQIGDSLSSQRTADACGSRLLFDSTSTPATFQVNGVAGCTLFNHALGGTTPQMGEALAGVAVDNSRLGSLSTGAGMGLALGPFLATQWASGARSRVSPLFARGADLLVIGYHNSQGGNKLSHIENLVRRATQAGMEVIVWATNSAAMTDLQSEGQQLASICDLYGAAFVDIWAHFKYRRDLGNDAELTTDSLHYSAAGYALWAKSFRGVVNLLNQESQASEVPNVRLLPDASASVRPRFAEVQEVAFVAGNTTGTQGSGAWTTVETHPGLLYGGRLTTNAVLALGAGQFGRFAHPLMTSLHLIVEADSAFSAIIRLGATDIKTVNYVPVGGAAGQPWIVEALSTDEVASLITSGLYAYGKPGGGIDSAGLFVLQSSGTVRLMGVMFGTLQGAEVNLLTDPFYSGTWVNGAFPIVRYSNTNLDFVQFSFVGRGCQIILHGGPSAGIVDITVDGLAWLTGVDLYRAALNYYPLTIFPDYDANGTPIANCSKTEHTVRIALNGANGSAAAGTGTAPRLGIDRLVIY